MACITSSVDLLYSIKTSGCCWILFIKENLILLISPFSFNIRLNHCLQLRERSSILLVALEINKLCSNAPIKHFARDIRGKKWHPYNVEAKVTSFVK